MKILNHRNISRLLQHSTRAMIKKLERDKDKPDFLVHSLQELNELKVAEDIELDTELIKFNNLGDNYESMHELLTLIEDECADVLNITAMMVLKCKQLKGEL